MSDRNHVYGGVVAPCPYYDAFFDLKSIPYWRSVGKREDVEANIEAFFVPTPASPDDIVCALERVLKYLDSFFDETLRPLSAKGAVDALPNDSSPGFPYSVNGHRKKGDIKDQILRDYKVEQSKFCKTGDFDLPCLAGLRLALARKPKNKPRLVWIYPAVVQAAEAKFFMPVYAQLFHCRLFSWDFSFLRGEIGELDQFVEASPVSFGTDVSTFDATVSAQLIRMIFDWMKSKFRLTCAQLNEFDAVARYFINTPLWYQNHVLLKRKGVPSGSFFTQLIDSVVNLSYQLVIVERAVRRDCPGYIMQVERFSFLRVLGDDSLVALDDWFSYHLSKSNFSYSCNSFLKDGISIHPEKGFYRLLYEPRPQKGEFLGFTIRWNSNARDWRFEKDSDLVLSQCVFPENAEKDPGLSYARLIGIKWSTGDDPELLEIVNTFFDMLMERYPDADPTKLPREYEHLFKYVFGNMKIDPTYYPSDEEVIDRYHDESYSPVMSLLRALPSNVRYSTWLLRSWRKAKLRRVFSIAGGA